MINEEKIKDMVKLAEYEKTEGKRNYIVNSYFGFDYVERHMMGGFAAYSVCFLMFFLLVLIYRADELMGQTDVLMILKLCRPYLGYYAGGLIIYEIIILIVYIARYSIVKRDIKLHSSELKRFARKHYS